MAKITNIEDFGTIVTVTLDEYPYSVNFDHRMFRNLAEDHNYDLRDVELKVLIDKYGHVTSVEVIE